jgi:pimeloyl-ACP methyl ester carboxylesterase
VYNELGARVGDYLRIRDLEAVRSVPTVVVAAEQDRMCSQEETEALAVLTGGDYRLLGRDWALPGYGHLAPIERGSERIAEHVLSWLDDRSSGE